MAKSKIKKRSTACKVLCASFLTALVIQNSYLYSFPVYADDGFLDVWELINDALGVSDAVITLSNSVITEYTSLDPATLAMLEMELGAVNAVAVYLQKQEMYADYGITVRGDGSYSTTGIALYIDGNGITQKSIVTIQGSDDEGIFYHADFGSWAYFPIGATVDFYTVAVEVYTDTIYFSNNFGGTTGSTMDVVHRVTNYWDLVGGQTTTHGDQRYSVPMVVGNRYSAGGTNSPTDMTTLNYGRTFAGYLFEPYILEGDSPLDLYNQAYDLAVSKFGQTAVDNSWVDLSNEFTPPVPMDGSIDDLVLPPGIPSASFNAPEIPSEPLPQKMLEGAGFWFTQFDNLLEGLGIKWIIIIFMCVALLMAILRM